MNYAANDNSIAAIRARLATLTKDNALRQEWANAMGVRSERVRPATGPDNEWVAYIPSHKPYPQGYGASREEALSDFFDKFDRIACRA